MTMDCYQCLLGFWDSICWSLSCHLCGQWDLAFNVWDFDFRGRDLASSQFLQWDLEPAGINYILLIHIPGYRIPPRHWNISSAVRILGGVRNHSREEKKLYPGNATSFKSSDKVSPKGPEMSKLLTHTPKHHLEFSKNFHNGDVFKKETRVQASCAKPS